jgi:hypothetical protein
MCTDVSADISDDHFAPYGWQPTQYGNSPLSLSMKSQSSLNFIPSSKVLSSNATRLPSGMVEQLAGAVKVVVNGPKFSQVTTVVNGGNPSSLGSEIIAVAITLVVEVTGISVLSVKALESYPNKKVDGDN